MIRGEYTPPIADVLTAGAARKNRLRRLAVAYEPEQSGQTMFAPRPGIMNYYLASGPEMFEMLVRGLRVRPADEGCGLPIAQRKRVGR